MATPLLQFQDFSIQIAATKSYLLHPISFSINTGEIVGLIGESGSGKSILSSMGTGLSKSAALTLNGHVWFHGSTKSEILTHTKNEQQSFLRKEVAYIFQEPMSAFNPVYSIKHQLQNFHPDADDAHIAGFLNKVGLDAEKIQNRYPHQLSGGQLQRIGIASAFIKNCPLIIADEITTALDPDNARNINEILVDLSRETQRSVLYISHDLALVKDICQRVLVLKEGQLKEQGLSTQIFAKPKEAYTQALLSCNPRNADKNFYLPTVGSLQNGEKPKAKAPKNLEKNKVILRVNNLAFSYPNNPNVFEEINFELKQSETLGIQGISGSGKSTLAKCLAGIMPFNDGEIALNNLLLKYSEKASSLWHHNIQYIFQNPQAALNPRMRIGQQLKDAIRYSKNKNQRPEQLLNMVLLPENVLNKYPHQLSGGQKQRVNIARCLAKQPSVLVLDESVAALDVSVQATILNLLHKLQEELGLAYIFIAHDHDMLNYFCDRVLSLSTPNELFSLE